MINNNDLISRISLLIFIFMLINKYKHFFEIIICNELGNLVVRMFIKNISFCNYKR